VRDLPETVTSLSERLANLIADEATTQAHAGDDDRAIVLGHRMIRGAP
jgi:hypothetical protein